MQSLFKDGLIINLKARMLKTQDCVCLEDLNIFYNLLVKGNNTQRINYLACDLYYQSLKFLKAREVFYNCIEKKLKLDDHINDYNMFLIFNVLEFEEKFGISSREELLFLFNYLSKFSEHKKNFEHYILFYYYKSVVYFLLKDYKEYEKVNTDLMNFIANYKANPQAPFNRELLGYIELKNSILSLKSKKQCPSFEINECIANSDMVFQSLIQKNKILAIKIGMNIYELYIKKNQFHQCLNLLKTLQQLLKDEMYCGISVENGIDYYLAISSRVAFCSSIVGDKKRLISAIKKIDKSLEFLDVADKKNKDYKDFFDFLLLLYRLSMGTNNLRTEKVIEIINNFKKAFDLENNLNRIELNPDKPTHEFSWLFKDCIPFYINIYAINSLDPLAKNVPKYVSDFISLINNPYSDLLPYHKILNFVIGLYNVISEKSLSIIKDQSKTQQDTLRAEIQSYCDIFFSYVKNMYIMIPIFKEPFIKNVIIKLYYIYLSTYFAAENYEETERKIQLFESGLKLILIVNENEVNEFGYIIKIKGDLAFKKAQYHDAINYYNQAIPSLRERNKKIEAVMTFNKGLSYIYLNQKDKGIECLEEANRLFRVMGQTANVATLSKININNYLESKINCFDEVINGLN